ncbi:heparan-alpha-glucosaminide N-acetyltransferase [Sporotomaculum syntrophicum]|nr:heparan-alpha-glucosaminide N-acetyltransferase [Sporotomaculum syntrophicum]
MQRTAQQRLWEIDLARGTALILMIIYHLLYDLSVFFNFDIAYNHGIFYLLGKVAATLFILVAGLSSSFSKNNTTRGLKLIGWGCVIYLVTSIAVPGSNIVFGILQFLGVCLLLYPVVKNISPYILVGIGAAVMLGGEFTASLSISHNWLVPLGFRTPGFASVDYFPLIPWWGVFLWGIALSKLVYPQKKGLIKSNSKLLKLVAAAGRHTLFIYLLHQPVLLAALYLIFDPAGFFNLLTSNSSGSTVH